MGSSMWLTWIKLLLSTRSAKTQRPTLSPRYGTFLRERRQLPGDRLATLNTLDHFLHGKDNALFLLEQIVILARDLPFLHIMFLPKTPWMNLRMSYPPSQYSMQYCSGQRTHFTARVMGYLPRRYGTNLRKRIVLQLTKTERNWSFEEILDIKHGDEEFKDCSWVFGLALVQYYGVRIRMTLSLVFLVGFFFGACQLPNNDTETYY